MKISLKAVIDPAPLRQFSMLGLTDYLILKGDCRSHRLLAIWLQTIDAEHANDYQELYKQLSNGWSQAIANRERHWPALFATVMVVATYVLPGQELLRRLSQKVATTFNSDALRNNIQRPGKRSLTAFNFSLRFCHHQYELRPTPMAWVAYAHQNQATA